MDKPDTNVNVHRCFFIKHEQKAKEALIILLQKESLDDDDIQAIKILTEMLEAMVNPLQENDALLSVIHNNDDSKVICPMCHKPDCSANANFCTNCGSQLKDLGSISPAT